MDPKPSGAPGSNDGEIDSLLEFLRGRGDWLSYHFSNGSADQIEEYDIQEIIDTCIKVKGLLGSSNRSLYRRVEEIEDSCYSGKRQLRSYETKTYQLLRTMAQKLAKLRR